MEHRVKFHTYIILSLLLFPFDIHALDCPPMPEQSQKDWNINVDLAVGKIARATIGKLQAATRTETRDLLSKLPDANRVYLEQMMLATYCSALRDDTTLSESDKGERVKAYNREVRSTFQSEKPKEKQESDKRGANIGGVLPRCIIAAGISADVISRVYYRDRYKNGEQILNPNSQELFYEWTAQVSTNNPVKDIVLEIRNLRADDRVSISPANAKISEPEAKWHSGYPEPHRSTPDYYSRTATFPQLLPQRLTGTISIRRFLERPRLSSSDLITLNVLNIPNCKVATKSNKYAASAEQLEQRAMALVKHVSQSNPAREPVPIRRDPGELNHDEVEATLEIRCESESCSKLTVGKPVGRSGKSPSEHAMEQRVENLNALKKELREAFDCIEEPYEDPDPSNERLVISGCGLPTTLTPQQLQRITEIMKKHGAQVEIMLNHPEK